MSSPIVRRLTAVLTLVAALWLAAPSAADAATRPTLAKTRVTLGSSFMDQVMVWLAGFWPVPAPAERSRQEKSGTVPTGGASNLDGVTNGDSPSSVDRGGMIDPNGGW